MTPNRLTGHGLPYEGQALRWSPRFNDYVTDREGNRTRCECGEWSPDLPSNAARVRWHRDHKNQIRTDELLRREAQTRSEQ